MFLVAFTSTYILDFLSICPLDTCASMSMTMKNSGKDIVAENSSSEQAGKSCSCCVDDQNCCDNDANLSQHPEITKLITTPVDIRIKSLMNYNLPKDNFLVINHRVLSENLAKTYQYPPPKIPDIRVFIQSFII